MQPVARRPLRIMFVVLVLGVAVWLGPGLTGIRAVDDMDDMEMKDLCTGEMQWMIGWCIDNLASGDSEIAAAGSSPDVGVFETIDVPVPGATATRAFGINPQGDIVGSYTEAGVTHGYLLSNGTFTTIDYPDSSSTEAWGINPGGDIIGRYTVPGRPNVFGFLRSHGRFTDISIASPTGPGGKHLITLPTKIGASGHVVGCFHDASNVVDMYGYVQRGSDVATFALPPVGPTSAMHNGITPGGGTIVGLTFLTETSGSGYILSRGTLTRLDFPGSTSTQAWDVNPRGTIVGQHNASGRTHGFYRDESGFVSFDVPDSRLTVARGINPEGDIVGVYTDQLGKTHGFLLRR
jgi:uncharacterized membrane protein